MIELSKLEQNDFTIFKSWIKNQDELFQFAGPIFKFPVTDDQLLRYINDSKRIAYKVRLIESNEIIGNAELNFENPLPRLSRILIGNKAYRNKGLGKIIVNKMLEKLFFEYNFQQVDLNVFDWNKAAIKCYQSVGFVINPDIVYRHNCNNEIWTAINMTISKKDWIKNDSNKDIKNAST
jgi:RimJ/RimL family protein N-acetyltransferase